MTSMQTNYQRQADIFNPERVTQAHIHVIGCGTIGSWVTLGLHKLGIENVTLWDFDTVEDVNIPNQNFEHGDIGKNKARVLANKYDYTARLDRYDSSLSNARGDIYILAVDSLEARREILAQLLSDSFVIDGRMSGEGYEVHVGNAHTIKVPESASEDLCTAKGIVYVSMGIAAEIVNAVKQRIMAQPIDYKIIYRDYKGGNTLKISLPRK